MRFSILVLVLVGMSAAADAQIHKCLLDDGTIAFQQMPCAKPTVDHDDGNDVGENSGEPDAVDDDVSDFINPFDEPTDPPARPEPELPEPVSQDRAECEKVTRDAIDAIDLEMRNAPYTKEQGEEYLAELLALTQQLRACKQL